MENVKNTQLELLAPAGSYDAFIAAVNAGADAVYMGLNKFNARVMTNNFNNVNELYKYKKQLTTRLKNLQ